MRVFWQKFLNKSPSSSKTAKYGNPFVATSEAVTTSLTANPELSALLSVGVFLTYGLAALTLWWSTRQISAQDQQIAALISFVILAFLAIFQIWFWLASILLIRESRARKRPNLHSLVSMTRRYFISFLAIFLTATLITGVFGILLIKATDPLSNRLQIAIWFFVFGVFSVMVAVKMVLSLFALTYENAGFSQALSRGLHLSRKRGIELAGTLITEFVTAGISLATVVGHVGGVDSRYHQYTSIEQTGNLPNKRRHWLNDFVVALALLVLLGLSIIGYARVSSNDPVEAAGDRKVQKDTENFCFYSSANDGFTCSPDRATCMLNKECKATLEARDELDELLTSPLD